jgi:hypothetical protein
VNTVARTIAGACSVLLALVVTGIFWLPAVRSTELSFPVAVLVNVAGLVVFGMTFALLYGWALARMERE